jgi:hypothetical protein
MQIKYQPITAKKPIRYKIINKFQPEHAKADTPSPKLKTK